MRRLILVRHSKADPSAPGMTDHARPLTARGAAAAARIGAYVARHHLLPDHVLCSTAQRTRETWAGIASKLDAPPEPTFERRLYEASSERILSVVQGAPAQAGVVMVIGHNPGLHRLSVLLVAAGDVELRESLREKFPTSGLVVIDFAVDSWEAVHPLGGRLDRFISPRALEGDTA